MPTRRPSNTSLEISALRRTPAIQMRAHERRQAVTNRVIQDLKAAGTFFNTPEGYFYFRRGKSPKLWPIDVDSVALSSFVHDQYGINRAEEREYRHLMSGFETEAELRGEKAEVHRLAHFDSQTERLYVSRFDGMVYRLNGKTIKRVPNGTDGVFFSDQPQWQPYTLLAEPTEGSFHNLIMRSANFSEAGDLSCPEQHWVFYVWCLGQFFASMHPTKPLLLICGEKGGGKTLCLRKWVKLLFGAAADVTGLERGKQDGFVAAVCSSPIAVFDNVDEHVSWLPDHLAQLATGIKFERRKYYTTNEVVQFQPQCFVALTSRTPKFIDGRDDVLDRTLVLNTERRERFSPEQEQLQAIAVNRNAIWTELLLMLNRIVAGLTNNEEQAREVCFRMADFASFALTVARVEGQEEMAEVILKKLDSARTNLLLADEPISVCLEKWLEKDHKNHGRPITSGDLNKQLRSEAVPLDIPWPYASGQALGQRLSHIITNLKTQFEVTVEKNSSKQALYQFRPKLKAEPAGIAILDDSGDVGGCV